MDYDQIRRYMGNDLIEIAPLAYMRGRTLNDAVIILDEGQNATVPQMKMFLTRMGQNARIVVTGDTSQVNLPAGDRQRPGRRGRAAPGRPRDRGHARSTGRTSSATRWSRRSSTPTRRPSRPGGPSRSRPRGPAPSRPARGRPTRLGVRRAPGPASGRGGGAGRKSRRCRRGALRRGTGLGPVDRAWLKTFHELW